MVTLAQGLVGYVQYLTKLPEVLVLAHMFGASILVVVIVRAIVLTREPVAADDHASLGETTSRA